MLNRLRSLSSCRYLPFHRCFKSVVCTEYGKPLIVQESARMNLSQGQVRIRTHFAGINYADILAYQGRYQEKSKPPFIPGLEVSGEVIECNECNRLHVGDRVFCIFGANGAFSEECIVNERSCFLVPKSIPLHAISSLGINFCTAALGLCVVGKMGEDDVVTITGAAGGTGLAATELSLASGNETVCVVRGSEQKYFLEELIASQYPSSTVHVIDSEATPVFKDQIKSWGGSSVVFDPVGTDAIFTQQLLRSVRFGAHIHSHLSYT